MQHRGVGAMGRKGLRVGGLSQACHDGLFRGLLLAVWRRLYRRRSGGILWQREALARCA